MPLARGTAEAHDFGRDATAGEAVFVCLRSAHHSLAPPVLDDRFGGGRTVRAASVTTWVIANAGHGHEPAANKGSG
jgi:hypothetical protein